MQLSKDDHIDVGVGWLYGPPFVAAFLLYRLFNRNSSILVRHRAMGAASNVRSFPEVSLGDLTVTTNVASNEGPPSQVYVHHAASSTSSVEDLLRTSATRLALLKAAPAIATFGDVALRIDSFLLPFTEKLMLVGELAPLSEFRMAKSPYCVSGRISVSQWPGTIRPKKIPVWKVSVQDATRKAPYDFNSEHDWSLTAFDIEEGFEPSLAVSLKKSSA